MLFETPTMMIFPGQGSQRIGMLNDYAEKYSLIIDVFNKVSAVCGDDLWDIAQNGPVDKLNDTRYTQPIMFAADLAIWHVWQLINGIKPQMVAGHSLGEYAALVASEILTLEDAAKLVFYRGQLMAEAFPEGEGAVAVIINVTEPELINWCDSISRPGHEVSIANINSPIQLVVAGHRAAVEEVLTLAKEKQVKLARLLPVSVPVHCPLMKGTADKFKQYIEAATWQQPQIPVIFNVDALCHYQVETIKDALYQQLFKPVQWVKTMDLLMQNKPALIVESGPGNVLTGLLSRTFKQTDCNFMSLSHVSDLEEICQNG